MPTRRQEIAALLRRRETGFEELREYFEVSVRLLASDLAHVDRSLRSGHERLRVTPPHCLECGFELAGSDRRQYHPPSRCPRCKSGNLEETRYRIA